MLCEALEDRTTPTIYTVNALTDTGAGSGTTGDLRYCLTQSNGDSTATPDTIVFSVSGAITLSSQLTVSRTSASVTIDGTGQSVAISGNNATRVFVVGSEVVAGFTNLTVENGDVADSGAGILNAGGAVTVTSCTFTNNSSITGGAIYSSPGSLTVTGSTFSGNAASSVGGGIYITGASSATISNSTFSGNTSAGEGGAIDAVADTNQSLTLTITNCTITGNSSPLGAGINVVTQNGEAGTPGHADITIKDSTIAGNTSGAGFRAFSLQSSTQAIDLGGTIIANALGDLSIGGAGAVVTSLGYNLIDDASLGAAAQPTDLQSTNPLLAPLDNYGGPTQTMALLPGSPALDAGDTSDNTVDQRGVAVQNGRRDIGAFESHGFALAYTGGNNQSTPADGSAFANPLVVTVTANDPTEPVQGGLVTFTTPVSGASAVLTGNPATIQPNGTASVTAASNTTAGGPYTVTATALGATGSANFSLTNTFLAQTITFVISPSSATYGDAPITLSASGGGSGNAVTFTIISGPGTINGSTLTITGAGAIVVQADQAGNGQYAAASPVQQTLTVNAAVLTILPDSGQSKIYGAVVPALTYTPIGFVNGDTASILAGLLGTDATASSPVVGDYAFNLGTLDAGPNYTLVLDAESPTFVVTPAQLFILPDSGQSKVYGAAVPSLTYTPIGLVNGDTASILKGLLGTDATASSPVGDYAFNLGTLDAGPNYTLVLGQEEGPTFAVTPATLIVTANNATRYVDEANPVFTAGYGGFVNGDSVSSLEGSLAFTTTAVGNSSPAGTYPITPFGLSSPNYTIQYVDGTLTVLSVLNPRVPLVAIGAGPGGGPRVQVFNADGSLRFNFFAYDSGLRSGVSVATGDVNGDGTDDIITGTGDGGGANVKVFDGNTGEQILSFFAYDSTFHGGVWVSAGEVNGQTVIVTGAGNGGAPLVRVFDASTAALIDQFMAGDSHARGGVRVAFAVDSGRPIIVTGAGPGEPAAVGVYDASTFEQLAAWQPYGPGFTGGVYVAAGENPDGSVVIATGPGVGGGPRLELYSGSGTRLQNIFADTSDLRNGLTVAILPPFTSTDRYSVLTGAGDGVQQYVLGTDGSLTVGSPFAPFGTDFLGGVFVG